MSSGIKYTQEEAIALIEKRCDELDLEFIGFVNDENVYTNNTVKLILKCKKCGCVFDSINFYKLFNRNIQCKKCGTHIRLTEEEMSKLINDECTKHDFEFLGYAEKYNGKNTKLVLKCNKCGAEWSTTTINNFLREDRKSHTCGRNNPSSMPVKHDIDKIIEKINKKLKGSTLEFVSFCGEYTGINTTTMILRCKRCGKEEVYRYHWLMNTKYVNCKYCDSIKRFSYDDAIAKINKRCEEKGFTFLGFANDENLYFGKKTRLILRCNKCGTVTKTKTFCGMMSTNFICSTCGIKWHMENDVEEMLKRNNIEYFKNYRGISWLKYKIPIELDFYIPSINVGIECQGRQHFEPDRHFGGKDGFKTTIARDTAKYNLCKEHGLRVLYYNDSGDYDTFLGEKVIKSIDNLDKILKENISL